MWVEYELSIFEGDEWLLIEYVGVASLSISPSHTPHISACGKHISPTDAADQPPLTPLWTWAARPQTFHIKVNFRTCSDDHAVCKWGLGSADPCYEAYCCAQWHRACARVCLRLCPKPDLILSSLLNMTASLLRAKAQDQFSPSQSISRLRIPSNPHMR